MEEKKKYLKPVIEDEEILIEDICSVSGEQENSADVYESEGEVY